MIKKLAALLVWLALGMGAVAAAPIAGPIFIPATTGAGATLTGGNWSGQHVAGALITTGAYATANDGGGGTFAPAVSCPNGADSVTGFQDAASNWWCLQVGPQIATAQADTLAHAASAATALGKGLFISPQGVTLAGATTITAPSISFDPAARITGGSYTLAFAGPVIANPRQPLFDKAGTGTVTFEKNAVLSVGWFNPTANGTTSDSGPLNRAEASACATQTYLTNNNGVTSTQGSQVGVELDWPGLAYNITSTVTIPCGYVSNYGGQGGQITTLIFSPTASGDALALNSGTGNISTQDHIRGFHFLSADQTYVKVGFHAYDMDTGSIFDITCSGTYSPSIASYWHDSTDSSKCIEIDGRDQLSIGRLELQGDMPIYIGANPNTTAAENEDCNGCHFTDVYLLPYANYGITVLTGRGVQNLTTDGYAFAVGGLGFMTMDDTRSPCSVPSTNLVFGGLETEQQSGSAWQLHLLGTSGCPLSLVTVNSSEVSSASNGFDFAYVVSLGLNNVQCAASTNCLTVTGATTGDTITFSNDTWGSPLSLSGYVLSTGGAYASQNYDGPSTATYSTVPGIDMNDQVSCPHIGGMFVCSWGADGNPLVLTASTPQALLFAMNTHGVTSYWGMASCPGGYYGMFQGTASAINGVYSNSTSFVSSASPSAAQLGIAVSSNILEIVPGSSYSQTGSCMVSIFGSH